MNQGLLSVKNYHSDVYEILPELMASMIDLTTKYEQKPLNNINKQFQDCIMNYFFEDYVGDLIKNKFKSQTKTYIKDQYMIQISNEIQEKRQKKVSAQNNKLKQKEFIEKKYMLLPQKYLQEIFEQKKEKLYISLLVDIALEQIKFPVGELRWRSQIRKKTFAALLLVHYYNNQPIQTIFEMWDNTFPSFTLKKQKKLDLSQQSLNSNHLQKENLSQQIYSQTPINQNEVIVNSQNHSISNMNQVEIQFEQKMFDFVDIYEPNLTKKRQLNHYYYNFPSEIKLDESNVKLSNNIEEDQFSISNYLIQDSQSVYEQSSTQDNNSIFIQDDDFHNYENQYESTYLNKINLTQRLQQNLLPLIQNTQYHDVTYKNIISESEFYEENQSQQFDLFQSFYSSNSIGIVDEDFYSQQVQNSSLLSSENISQYNFNFNQSE